MPGRPGCCARSNTTLPGVTPSRALGASRSASDQPSSASTWSASRPSRNSLTARLDLLLSGNAPRVGSQWTDSGSAHDQRHLKHRARKTTRPVPIPPEIVNQIRTHIDRFGVSADGRLFRGARGSLLSESSYGRVWQLARKKALTAAQANSPLARRPYDLRHSGVTLGLNAGVPAPEVARRAGHGVAVLLRVYAGCIDGHEQLWNIRIDDALRDETAR
jgi:integrase